MEPKKGVLYGLLSSSKGSLLGSMFVLESGGLGNCIVSHSSLQGSCCFFVPCYGPDANSKTLARDAGGSQQNRTPNSGLQHFYGVDFGALRWIHFWDLPRAVGKLKGPAAQLVTRGRAGTASATPGALPADPPPKFVKD